MNYLPLQIIVSVFVMLVIFRLTKKFKDSVLKTSEFISWLVIWAVVLVAFWLPNTASYLALLLGIGRGVDLAVYSAILILFYLIFRLYLKHDRQQQQITKIIRHLALTEGDEERESK
jgi:hypothetical protein